MLVFTIFLLTIFLGVIAYMDLFQYFVSEEYRVGLNVVPILLLANFCLGIYYNLSIWYKVSDKTIYGAYISGIGAAITLVLNFILVPRFGYLGAAYTTLICYASIMIICWAIGQKFYPVKYPIKRFFTYLILALGLFFVMNLFQDYENNLIRLGINTLCVLIFIAVAFVLDLKKVIKK
jgi:O-antigen/teichoic acid export membrane protein